MICDSLYGLNPLVYIHTGGAWGCTESVYRERNLHIRTQSLPSTQRRVPTGHEGRSSILHLHDPSVWPMSHSPDARGPPNPGLPYLRRNYSLPVGASWNWRWRRVGDDEERRSPSLESQMDSNEQQEVTTAPSRGS